MSVDAFKAAEDEFTRLRSDLIAGRLSLDQFHNTLKQGKVRDSLGREWAIGAETGKWYVREGGKWAQSDPYQTAQGATPGSPIQIEPAAPSTPQTSQPSDAVSAFAPSEVIEPVAPPRAQPPIGSRTETIPASQMVAQMPSASAAAGRRPSRTALYLLVVVLGMCAIILALVAVGVILAASRGYY